MMAEAAPTRTRHAVGGFTLLEAMLALAILAVGLLALARMHMTAIQSNTGAQTLTVGNAWAGNFVEELTAIDYGDDRLVDTNGDGADGLDHTGEGADHIETRGIYDISWNVSDDDPVVNAKTLRVIVAWQEGGRTRRVALTCIKPQL